MAMLGETIFFQKPYKKNQILYDAFGHSPIYYSIKCKHQVITDLLLEYMCYLNEEEQNPYIVYLNFNEIGTDLPVIIRNSSSKLDYFCQNLMYQINRIHFGYPKKKLPIIETSNFGLIMFEDFTSNEGDKNPLKIKQTAFTLTFGIGSKDSKELISAIISCQNLEIFRTEFIQYLINKRWEEIAYCVYLYTIILWSNLLILYFVIESDQNIFSLFAMLINVILISWEAIQFTTQGKIYFTDIMNIFDLFRFFFTTVYIFWHLFGIEYSLLTWIMMTLNLIRGLTGFRAFNNTRYFIRLIYMCIIKIKDFFIIFIYATLSLGLMNSISASESFDYYSIWSSPFGIIVGKTDTFYETNFIQSITFIIAVTTNMIIMLNMIISILGDEFDEFQLNAEIYNYTEMAQVISETEQIISYFGTTDNKKYLHVCIHAYEATGTEWKGKVIDLRDYLKDDFFTKYLKPSFDENQKQISEETEKIKVVSEEVNAVSGKVKAVSEEVKAVSGEVKVVSEEVKVVSEEEVKVVSEKVKAVSEEVKIIISEKVKVVSEEVKVVSEEVKAVSEEVKTSMNDLKNRVEDIEKSISNIQGSIELVLKILNK
ncbi:hypothetical protein SteCoe_28406 [Stentor coeruleus]|uniref:Ion transport domain-containing protein n=1 Tax=Stentor coeruleus TaxID=5963 RepID=A0A1R2B888_9CILI|nr:hypothetical protein SteCoe_28406 [Stentor coeruleus]